MSQMIVHLPNKFQPTLEQNRFLTRKTEKTHDDDFLTLLENTKGIWQHGDGLVYQEKLRTEWDG